MTAKTSQSLQIVLKIARDLGCELNPESVIMDFGCGAGKVVGELRGLGYQAFGCDIKFKDEDHADTKSMQSEKLIRLIDMQSYKLPFEDETFDIVISDQVFEHVQNYSGSTHSLRNSAPSRAPRLSVSLQPTETLPTWATCGWMRGCASMPLRRTLKPYTR